MGETTKVDLNWLRRLAKAALNRAWKSRAAFIARAEKAEAEAKALREALTPSASTKAAYIGKFSFSYEAGVDEFGDDLIFDNVSVPWTTIKEIMAAIRSRALTANHPVQGD